MNDLEQIKMAISTLRLDVQVLLGEMGELKRMWYDYTYADRMPKLLDRLEAEAGQQRGEG